MENFSIFFLQKKKKISPVIFFSYVKVSEKKKIRKSSFANLRPSENFKKFQREIFIFFLAHVFMNGKKKSRNFDFHGKFFFSSPVLKSKI